MYYNETKVRQISISELAYKIAAISSYDVTIDFWEDIDFAGRGINVYSAKFIHEFDSDMLIINIWGGGSSTVIDFSPGETCDDEIIRLIDCLNKYADYIGTECFYIPVNEL